MEITPHFYTSEAISHDFQNSYLSVRRKGAKTAEVGRGALIPNWLAAIGAPGIAIVGKDRGIIGKIWRDPPSRNIVLQTVIKGNRQSLGATERRRGHFRTTISLGIGEQISWRAMNGGGVAGGIFSNGNGAFGLPKNNS